jgi:hypothetical protein
VQLEVESLVLDFRLAHDRVAFARYAGDALGITSLDHWQEDFLRSRSRRVLLLASRQSGKSTITAIIALHRALYQPDSLVLVFGPSQDQSLEFFRKVSIMYRAIAGELPEAESLTKLGLELANGSRSQARPGSEKTARGRTASMLIVDEAARIEDELYDSLRPMLATTEGDLLMLSTPFGKRGAFFEAWEYGSEWERYKITVYDCPRIPEWFIENERRERPEHVFRREYLCEFDDAENVAFREADISAMADPALKPLFG